MKTAIAQPNYLPEVRNQYENYPYPYRNPQLERQEFHFPSIDALCHINHYNYAGKKDFMKGVRVLVAGGGTGDAVIALAEQLRGTPSEIFYVDISETSQKLARERANIRGLEENIQWIHGSLLDIPTMQLGEFDYINCSGVLHHLKDPEAGLAALAAVLKEDGVIGLMLYAPYGRAPLYQMQDIMRMLNRDEPDLQKRVDNCKPLMKHIKADWMRYILARFSDIEKFGDIGIYDMFLHSQDRAYSVPQLYEFFATSNLILHHFSTAPFREGNRLYRPEYYIPDKQFHKQLEPLSIPERQALAEMINGSMCKHMVFVAKTPRQVANILELDNVPFLAQFLEPDLYKQFLKIVQDTEVGQPIAMTITVAGNPNNIRFIKTPYTEHFFEYLDGVRSIGEIIKKVQSCYSTDKMPSLDTLLHEFKAIFEAFEMQDCMCLRHKTVSAYPTTGEMQKRVSGN